MWNVFWYRVVFVQMKDVYEGNNRWTAMSTLEGQLAGRQGCHQAVAFISTQGVVEFDGTCSMQACIKITSIKRLRITEKIYSRPERSCLSLPWHASEASTFRTVRGKVPLTLPVERSSWGTKKETNQIYYSKTNSTYHCASQNFSTQENRKKSSLPQSALEDTPVR